MKKSHLSSKLISRYLNSSGEPSMITCLDIAYEEISVLQYLNHPNLCKLYQVLNQY